MSRADDSKHAISAHKLQRKQRLEALVHKRVSNVNYIKKIHMGGSYWLNIMRLTQTDIQRFVHSVPKPRAVIYYYLGLSIHGILSIPTAGGGLSSGSASSSSSSSGGISGAAGGSAVPSGTGGGGGGGGGGVAIVKALSQLIEEFEYFCSGSAMQSVKLLMAKSCPCIYPRAVHSSSESDPSDVTLTKPSIFKFQNSVVFEYLKTPHLAFELDYVEVVLHLCDALARLYDKLLIDECFSNPLLYDTIVRLDGRIKHHFVNLVTKELTDHCCKGVRAETDTLRSVLERE